jgi:hypothetical protein
MLKDYIEASQKRMIEQVSNFYTSNGIQVYFKDQLLDDKIDVEKIVSDFERVVPRHLLEEVEMIIIGHFDEFEERNLTAFYKDGALHLSNMQMDENEMLTDMIHETAHACETAYGQEIYADGHIKDEFLRKRMYLYDILWKMGFKAPKSIFLDPEYDEEFDKFLFQDIGYKKLGAVVSGIFINAYAPTSLREYFATGFADFYLNPNDHTNLKNSSPILYKKIVLLHNLDKSD